MLRSLERLLTAQRERWMRHKSVRDVELYRRRSSFQGVQRDPQSTLQREGEDLGSAVRWIGQERFSGFISASGELPAPPDELLAQTEEVAQSPASWGEIPADDLESDDSRNRDPLAVLQALETDLKASLPRDTRMTHRQVDLARICESWSIKKGVCHRTRTLGWARVAFETGSREWPPPITVAADPQTLEAGRSWSEFWVERNNMQAYDRADGDARWLLLPAEPAARLARALVSHWSENPGRAKRYSVGPGWVIRDDPSDPRGIIRPSLDDALFPTAVTPLADGRRVVGAIPAEGGQRRPGFRDRPGTMPWHLIVEAEAVTPPPATVVPTMPSLQILDDEHWVLLDDERHWSFSAGEWSRRCVGGVGRALTTHGEVTTPGLLFEL